MANDDLISRQAAIDAVEFEITYIHAINIGTGEATDLSATANYKLEKAISRIKNIPSTERRGRWINGNEGIWNAVILPKCSICGETFYEMNVNINGEYPYNYCPNCGARMEGDE